MRDLVAESGLTIYDAVGEDTGLYYSVEQLETALNEELVGLDLDLPIRTRSKVAKQRAAQALGYPAPESFKRTQPRFPGQNLDVYVQQADNLQVWGEEIDPTRRYAFVRVGPDGVVSSVRVVTGEAVASWDTTGTLTSKYQARRLPGRDGSKLVSTVDTEAFKAALAPQNVPDAVLRLQSPTATPVRTETLSISRLSDRLGRIVGMTFDDPGPTKDRERGAAFHRHACEALGLGEYRDGGQFPDILSQALEVKLQLSPTIDLGLISPDSISPAESLGHGLAHRDTRYAVAYASVANGVIRIDNIVVATGADFFTEFRRFEGNVTNRKLQMSLPRDLFL